MKKNIDNIMAYWNVEIKRSDIISFIEDVKKHLIRFNIPFKSVKAKTYNKNNRLVRYSSDTNFDGDIARSGLGWKPVIIDITLKRPVVNTRNRHDKSMITSLNHIYLRFANELGVYTADDKSKIDNMINEEFSRDTDSLNAARSVTKSKLWKGSVYAVSVRTDGKCRPYRRHVIEQYQPALPYVYAENYNKLVDKMKSVFANLSYEIF